MNPERWASMLLKPRADQETSTDEDAKFLERNAPDDFFDQPTVRWWCFQVLARNANRANGKPTVRVPDTQGTKRVARRYRPQRLFTLDEYRDRLMQYRESIAENIGAARKLMAEAIVRFPCLRDEFPEFDPLA